MKTIIIIIITVILLSLSFSIYNQTQVNIVNDCKVIELQQQQLIKSNDGNMSTEIRYLVITNKETFICENSLLNGKFNNSDVFWHLKKDSIYNFKVAGIGKTFITDYRNILKLNYMNLHKEFYALRELIWQEFEKLVQEGCEIDGELPIIVGEYSLPANGLRTGGVHLTDTTNINIIGIRSDDEYAIFPKKENEKDINVTTNRIKVIVKKYEPKDEKFYTFEIDVEPDILDLQSLSTYVSGGFKAYEK